MARKRKKPYSMKRRKNSPYLFPETSSSLAQPMMDNMLSVEEGGYYNKLNDADKAWLLQFNREYYLNDLKASDPEEQLHKGPLRRECYKAYNSRREDLVTILEASRLRKGQPYSELANNMARNRYNFKSEQDKDMEYLGKIVELSVDVQDTFAYTLKKRSKHLESILKDLDADYTVPELFHTKVLDTLNDLGLPDTRYNQNKMRNFVEYFAALQAYVHAHKKDSKNNGKNRNVEKL